MARWTRNGRFLRALARRARRWADAVLSDASVRSGSSPGAAPEAAVGTDAGPLAHWTEKVRRGAPELLRGVPAAHAMMRPPSSPTVASRRQPPEAEAEPREAPRPERAEVRRASPAETPEAGSAAPAKTLRRTAGSTGEPRAGGDSAASRRAAPARVDRLGEAGRASAAPAAPLPARTGAPNPERPFPDAPGIRREREAPDRPALDRAGEPTQRAALEQDDEAREDRAPPTQGPQAASPPEATAVSSPPIAARALASAPVPPPARSRPSPRRAARAPPVALFPGESADAGEPGGPWPDPPAGPRARFWPESLPSDAGAAIVSPWVDEDARVEELPLAPFPAPSATTGAGPAPDELLASRWPELPEPANADAEPDVELLVRAVERRSRLDREQRGA